MNIVPSLAVCCKRPNPVLSTISKLLEGELVDGENENPDVLWGARAIAKAINKPERSVFHLLEAGHLPARKVGKQWVASRRKLVEALTGDE